MLHCLSSVGVHANSFGPLGPTRGDDGTHNKIQYAKIISLDFYPTGIIIPPLIIYVAMNQPSKVLINRLGKTHWATYFLHSTLLIYWFIGILRWKAQRFSQPQNNDVALHHYFLNLLFISGAEKRGFYVVVDERLAWRGAM